MYQDVNKQKEERGDQMNQIVATWILSYSIVAAVALIGFIVTPKKNRK